LIIEPPKVFDVKLKNVTLNWFEGDTLIDWKKNIKNNSDKLKSYIDEPIEYRFNNYGFRTDDDFNTVEIGNVFLGCSYMFGTGFHIENTCMYKVNQNVGGKLWNLSWPGTGLDSAFRLLNEAIKFGLKIKNVFHLEWEHPRYEYYHNELGWIPIGIEDWGASTEVKFRDKEWTNSIKMVGFKSLIHNPQLKIMIEKNKRAIKSLCEENNLNYILLNRKDIMETEWTDRHLDDINNRKTLNESDFFYSRDLLHASTIEQYQWAKKFLERI
jgi:hypothetical protein